MAAGSSFAALLVSDWLTDDCVITRLRAQLGNGVRPDERLAVGMELLRAIYRMRETRDLLRVHHPNSEYIGKALSSDPISGEEELFQEVLRQTTQRVARKS